MVFLSGICSIQATAAPSTPTHTESSKFKLYFSEDFEGESFSEGWDLENCTKINPEIGPMYRYSEKNTKWGAYIHDSREYPVELSGLYEMLTVPVQTDSNVALVLSTDVLYYSNSQKAQRSFGVCVRETGGEWDTLYSYMASQRDTLAYSYMDEKLTIPLEAKFAGKEVQLSFFFFNAENEKGDFVYGIDNVQFFSMEDRIFMNTKVVSIPGTYTDSLNIELLISNNGPKSVSTIGYAYQVNEGSIVMDSLVLESPLFLDSTKLSLNGIKIENARIGDGNVLDFWYTTFDGIPAQGQDTLRFPVSVADESTLHPFIPLMEEFAASWCPISAQLNRTLNPVLQQYVNTGQLNVVKYPVFDDPYYFDDIDARENFYGINGIPNPIYNGSTYMCWLGDLSSWNDVSKTLPSFIEMDVLKKSFFKIDFPKVKLDAMTGMLKVTVSVTPSVTFPMSELRLFTIITEGTTTGNKGSNGEREFYYITMSIAEPEGELLDTKFGEPVSFSYELDMSKTHVEEYSDLSVVCFIQNHDTEEVYQSASVKIQPALQATVEGMPITQGTTYRVSKPVNPAEYALGVPAYMTLENKTEENLVIGTQIRPVTPIAEGYSLQFCGFKQCYDYANISDNILAPGQIVGIDQINDAMNIQYNVPSNHVYGEPFEPLQVEVSFFDRTHLDSLSFFIDFVPVWAEDTSENLVPFDSAHFPDPIFREYIAGIADIFPDGVLSEYERNRIHEIDVPRMDIESLRGIEYFTKLHSLDCSGNILTFIDLRMNGELLFLDCSGNKLSSLDLSNNLKLQSLEADGNVLHVDLDDKNRFDASTLPGFNLTRASDWEGCSRIGYLLSFTEEEVSYRYETGYLGIAILPEVRFTFMAELLEENLLPINEEHFPDPAFREYVANADTDTDGQLSEDEIAGVTDIDVSDLGIRDLRGIGYFTEMESLDCSNNELTSLDLSANTKLEALRAEGNRIDITLDGRNGFNLSALPGFDLAKASDWEGCTRIGNLLTFTRQEATYTYNTGYSGENGAEGLQFIRFNLVADRDPSAANKNGQQIQGRVYVQDRVILTQDIPGEVFVFTPSGALVYWGTSNRIPVEHSGIYILRNREQVWKVFVL